MISTYSTLRTTGFLGTPHYHLLKTAVPKKVMNIGTLYMYFEIVMTPVVQSEADVYFLSSQNESLACQKRMWFCFRKNVFIICVSNNAPFPLKGLRTPEERQERLQAFQPPTKNLQVGIPIEEFKNPGRCLPIISLGIGGICEQLSAPEEGTG